MELKNGCYVLDNGHTVSKEDFKAISDSIARETVLADIRDYCGDEYVDSLPESAQTVLAKRVLEAKSKAIVDAESEWIKGAVYKNWSDVSSQYGQVEPEGDIKITILSFVNWNNDEFSVVAETLDDLFVVDGKCPVMDNGGVINVNMYMLDAEYCDRISIYKNGELMTNYGETWAGVVNAKQEWIEHFVSEYINGCTYIDFRTVSNEINDIKSYYDEVKTQTYAAKSGKVDSDISIYVELSLNAVLPLDIVSNEMVGYSDWDHFIMLNAADRSLITDYENYYASAIANVLENPNEAISYVNVHDSESIARAMKFFQSLTEHGIKCKLLFDGAPKKDKGIQITD